MSDLIFKSPVIIPAGEVIAQNVSEEDFLALYTDEGRYEWIEGIVIQMSPSSIPHQQLLDYLYNCFQAYFEINPIAFMTRESFMMRLGKSYREPDIIIVMNDKRDQLTKTMMRGAADICVEIVSPESNSRDYGDKLAEYETAGVREYWLIDSLREIATFYRLQENGRYTTIPLDNAMSYTTPLLPKFHIHVPTLWLEELPKFSKVLESVQKMWEE
jgi:Uma2 family endonuclease